MNNLVILHILHLRQKIVLTVSLLWVPNMTLCVSDLIWLGKTNVFKVAVTFPPLSYIQENASSSFECPEYLVPSLEQKQQRLAVLVVMSA